MVALEHSAALVLPLPIISRKFVVFLNHYAKDEANLDMSVLTSGHTTHIGPLHHGRFIPYAQLTVGARNFP